MVVPEGHLVAIPYRKRLNVALLHEDILSGRQLRQGSQLGTWNAIRSIGKIVLVRVIC
jgi:hypothetical protein